ncbi:hypothetical protein [Pseudomonas putida]|uniref:Lipoprotein n=1 Tax=Pseudomonas putida TaxID=303 RepID=A0A6S5TUI6_PSEPU|nr:hypothetical protein [Pseudomonas putida]BBT40916.1 hypothetical protein WP8W18C01_32570 [Pseudomonas putida]
MKRMITLGVVIAAIAGCELSEQGAISKGQEMVASTLKDPGSAMFSSVRMVETQTAGDLHNGYLCGQVNSKNSFGGYTGPKRFVANFQYTNGGRVEVSNVQLEEGLNAREASEGETIFERFDWSKKCAQSAAGTVAG